MITGSVNSIETFGLVDGPGIRTVVFLNGCKLRCKYCHNPEMWQMHNNNYTSEELVERIKKYKDYYGTNGGVTFSGGEPLLQSKFLIEALKLLKKDSIHTAIDTAGVGNGDYEEILKHVDLIIFDVKHTKKESYKDLTGLDITESLRFIEIANKLNKPFWIRQVIIPNLTDNMEYLRELKEFLKSIENIERVDFLPYHKLGSEKYSNLGINNPYLDMKEMDKEECKKLYEDFLKLE